AHGHDILRSKEILLRSYSKMVPKQLLQAPSGPPPCRLQGGHLGSASRLFRVTSIMQICDGIVEAIGNTPLIRLVRASEATGSTGIGLALVANARGYRSLIVIPETQSQEKKDMLRLCGAELVEVPAVPYSNPNNYHHIARRLADELRKKEPNGVLYADQWNNPD